MDLYLRAVRELHKKSDSEAKRKARKYLLEDPESKIKESGLLKWNSTKFMKHTVIPGTIVSFYYKKTLLPDKLGISSLTDSYPILLCTRSTKSHVSGINFNFCTYEQRANIINELVNIDEEFYEAGYQQKVNEGKPVISDKILSAFSKAGFYSIFTNFIMDKYNIKAIPFNTYSKSNIRLMNVVELWQWQYIPFFEQSALKEWKLQKVKELILQKIR